MTKDKVREVLSYGHEIIDGLMTMDSKKVHDFSQAVPRDSINKLLNRKAKQAIYREVAFSTLFRHYTVVKAWEVRTNLFKPTNFNAWKTVSYLGFVAYIDFAQIPENERGRLDEDGTCFFFLFKQTKNGSFKLKMKIELQCLCPDPTNEASIREGKIDELMTISNTIRSELSTTYFAMRPL